MEMPNVAEFHRDLNKWADILASLSKRDKGKLTEEEKEALDGTYFLLRGLAKDTVKMEVEKTLASAGKGQPQ